MTNQNPATPSASAEATPGSGAAVVTPPVGTPPASTQANGNNQAGTVTISTEEFARLQRADARTRSFGGRLYKKSGTLAANIDLTDPAAAALAEANRRGDDAERRAMQLEVRGKVRDLLSDERFKNIPESTKILILEKPHMLTDAESLDDAMYDIEDKLLEMSGKIQPSTVTPVAQPVMPTIETPSPRAAGAPAQVDAGVVIDTANLRGPARSVAVLRNAMTKAQAGGQS